MTTDDTGPIPIETEDRWALEEQFEVAQARIAVLEAQFAAETIAAAAADLLEPEPEGEERTIPPWDVIPCDECGCAYQASRGYSIKAKRFWCEGCVSHGRGYRDGVEALAAALAKPAPEVS